MGFVLVLEQGRIKPRVQVGFLGVRIYRYRPLARQSGGGNSFMKIRR
jgi:hypothetical protein